jgi:hypothetical protein
MFDQNKLISILKINGINSSTPREEIERVATLLHLNPEEKAFMYEHLQLPDSPAAYTAPTVATSPTQTLPPEEHHRNKLFIVLGLILLLIILCGVFFLRSSYGEVFLKNTISKDLFQNVVENAINTKTGKSKITASIRLVPREAGIVFDKSRDGASEEYFDFLTDFSQEIKKDSYVTSDSDLDFDMSNPDRIKFTLKSAYSTNADLGNSMSELPKQIKAEMIHSENNLFTKSDHVPSFMGNKLDQFANVWIKYSLEDAHWREFEREMYDNAIALHKAFGQAADETEAFALVGKPKKEMIQGTATTKYDIVLKEEKFPELALKMMEKLSADPLVSDVVTAKDVERFKKELQKDESKQLARFLNQNVKISVWLTKENYPIKLAINARVIPPDSFGLQDRQFNIDLTVETTKMNMPISIVEPTSYKTLEELMQALFSSAFTEEEIIVPDNVSDSEEESVSVNLPGLDAKVKANLSGIRAYSELVYDDLGGYGEVAQIISASCKPAPKTLFSDPQILSYITQIEKLPGVEVVCGSSARDGKVLSYVLSATLPSQPDFSWCIDSSGASKAVPGKAFQYKCQ